MRVGVRARARDRVRVRARVRAGVRARVRVHVAQLARLHPNGIGDTLQPVLVERLEVREVVVALLEEGVGVLAKVPGGEGRTDRIHRGTTASQISRG